MTIITVSIEQRNLFRRTKRSASIKMPDYTFGPHDRAEQERYKETIWTMLKSLLNATQRAKS
ncbi:hypothetical protein M0R72_13925 [Candidatus Pacearchaeota archaeon]|jgi:hypothetical protein|nr:hypothetical protein [Candidatus Pacearchaeota archaeon]